MDSFVLDDDRLREFLSALRDYTLWAPLQKDGLTLFKAISDPADLTLDMKGQVRVPKTAVFPQTEPLFTFDRKGIKHDAASEEKKESIIFGLRPCDARSLLILEPVFEGTIPDPYYARRRRSSVLIGLACTEPFAHCFCTSVGGNPFGREGLDLLFVKLNGSFLIEVITEKGRQIIDKTSHLFTSATMEDLKKRENLAQSSVGKIFRHLDLEGIPEKLSVVFEHSIWKQMASKCTGCGICTYTCPTCYCFDMQDESTLKEGRRVRIWDSCMFAEYTLHASGHNPRPTRAERLRNRIYHKFKFNLDNFGVVGCVGCGRCISLCPSNEDLIENLSSIKSLA